MSARAKSPPAATRPERSEARLEGRAHSRGDHPVRNHQAMNARAKSPPAATRPERSEARLEGRARAAASGAPAEPNPADKLGVEVVGEGAQESGDLAGLAPVGIAAPTQRVRG